MAKKYSTFNALAATAFAITAISCSLPARSEPKWPIPDGLKTVEVNGYDVAYQDAGSGAPVVLVHGALGDYRSWGTVVPEISKYYRVIAVSLRHGYPEKWDGNGNDFTFEQHAADVAALIKKLGLGKVHLVGHSRGGGVVVVVAKTAPEVIKTLTLEDAVGFEALLPRTPEDEKVAQEGVVRRETLKKNLAAGNPELAGQMFVDSLSGPGTWAKLPEDRKQRLFQNLGTAAQFTSPPATSCEEIAKWNFPILLVNGEKSPPSFPAGYAALRKCKTLARPLVAPNTAHNIHIDNPLFFNGALLGFLAHD